MPKMKTHSGAKKRFKVTGTGKVKRARAGMNHIMGKQKPETKRRLRKDALVDSTNEPRIKRLLIAE